MSRKSAALKIILFLVLFSGVDAQPSEGEWAREAFAGLNLSGGNSDVLSGNLNFSARKADTTRIDASASYGRSGGERNIDRSSASARYGWSFNCASYAGLGLNAARDSIAGVDYRYILSPVLGRRIVRSETADFSLEAGPAYISESILDEADAYLGLRFFELFERRLGGGSRFWQSFEYTFESGDDYLLGFEIGVVSVLVSGLSLRAAVEFDYDSSPAEGRKKYDTGFVTSLGFKF